MRPPMGRWKRLVAVLVSAAAPLLAEPAALSAARLGPSLRPLYDAVFAPQVVAVPPTFAVRDLCELPDGRLRHYGTETVAGENRAVYIESKDLGLSWTKHLADPRDAGAMVRSPWSGDWLCLKTSRTGEKVRCVRSKTDPGDVNAEVTELDILSCETRPPLALRSRRRWICPLTDVCRAWRSKSSRPCAAGAGDDSGHGGDVGREGRFREAVRRVDGGWNRDRFGQRTRDVGHS